MKTDYTKEIKNLIQDNYTPVDSQFSGGDYLERKTLSNIYKLVTNVLPERWIYESDIQEILLELGFKTFLHTYPEVEKDGEVIREEYSDLFYFMERKTAAI
ncbi:hypothetical protein [Zunongwangia endophytica]|uniref:Uncharacterized protein n=1 Tax=Zunongwangia endophytica TaxID=1808945 RepID=A0ABV8H8T2_9FLAO|nr:hypothetical protein [Zunongwangia endophytica]MDN3595316.1 hypothetical protein [Zunongwangia endophytica]